MNKLESGKLYSLKDIFSGENDKVVVPDLQRDYCWGDPNNNLVGQFTESLIENRKKELTMGIIYGFYYIDIPGHLQLCDGQQRLTTLFLILGILNRKLGFEEQGLRSCLMSDFELNNDDHEPHLLYAIRESSLYFLSDLTYYYLLNKGIENPYEINKQFWYLNDYDNDPTVQNIINAIVTIEKSLEIVDQNVIRELKDFLLDKVKFLFYDLENRENGEETFVVINTTGEPLTPTQNLKPLIIDKNKNSNTGIENGKTIAELWEEMETWFWQHRCKEAEPEHTADEGMQYFLHIVTLLHYNSEDDMSKATNGKNTNFPYTEIKFEEIWQYFNIYYKIYTMDFSERSDKPIRYPIDGKFTKTELYKIVPTMKYCKKFCNASDLDIKRIYHLFTNISRVSSNIDIFRASRLIEEMPNSDYTSLLGILNIDEEKPMIEMVARNIGDEKYPRNDIEEQLASAEKDEIFNGKIKSLVIWADYDMDKFLKYWNKFNDLWHNTNDMDLLRRALLAYGLPNFPINGGLCPNNSDWYDLITDVKNNHRIKEFLDDERSLEQQIDDFTDESSPMYEIIKKEKYLRYSQNKRIEIRGKIRTKESNGQFVVVKKKINRGPGYYILFRHVEFGFDMLDSTKWYAIWYYNNNCLYSDNKNMDITIEIFVEDDGIHFRIRDGKDDNKKPYPYFSQIGIPGFHKDRDGFWEGPIIQDAGEARSKFISISKDIDAKSILKEKNTIAQ